MLAISSLVKKLRNKFPEFTFTRGDTARWSPSEHTVYYNPNEPHAAWVILHETAHGALSHTEYSRDIELLRLEHQAWHHAKTILAPLFNITIDQEFIETQLDTYRNWLHAKSTCPGCHSSGLETSAGTYQCPHCTSTWKVNRGIDSAIRRYVTT